MSDQRSAKDSTDDTDHVEAEAGADPTATEHPAGDEQAAKNRDNESPS